MRKAREVAVRVENPLLLRIPCEAGCNEVFTVAVPALGFALWVAGELIQVAMPTVPVHVRELLISATCPTCWDAL